MIKISNIISLPIISLYEGTYLGLIYNITFDYKQKKCKYACILNEQDNITSIINCNDIYLLGKDCVFVKNSDCLQLKETCDKEMAECSNPINFKCYNLDGNYLGLAQDIEIDLNYNIKNIILDNGQSLKTESIANIGDLFLISDNKVRIAKFRPNFRLEKSITQSDSSKVTILTNTKQETSQDIQNNKIITDFRFLIGRILNKDILALNGEIIAKNGNVINKDIVNKASYYGKLVEIARYSKQKS